MEMVTVDLEDNPLYAALSYTWGDPKIYYLNKDDILEHTDWACPCYTISIDGKEVSISANLYAALASIRYVKSAKRYENHSNLHTDLVYIWIDALCINQIDLGEKSKQVLLMQRIYSQSIHVVAWLGGSDRTAETAVIVLAKLEKIWKQNRDEDGKYPTLRHLPERNLDDRAFYDTLNLDGDGTHISIRQWSHIIAFLKRAWFQRSWVVQERVHAKRTVVLCGLHVFNTGFLRGCMMFLRDMQILRRMQELERLIVAGNPLTDGDIQRRERWPNSPSEYTLFGHGNPPIWNSDTFFYIENVTDRLKVGDSQVSIPFNDCVRLFRSTAASDPRDKVYAFLSLSYRQNHKVPPALVPNYTLNARQVYLQTTKFLIQEDGHLGFLSMVEDPSLRKMDDLPSWVPDFGASCYPPISSRSSSLPFWADRGLGVRKPAFPESGVLEVIGYRLNQVTAIAKAKEVEESGLRAMADFLSALPSSAMFKRPMNVAIGEKIAELDTSLYVPQSRLEILWRTLIADRFRGQHPAPESCGQAYKISCRRYLSQLSADMTTSITSAEDFTTKYAHILDENDGFESLLLPGEMKSIRRQISERDTTKPAIVMMDGGDFGSSIPTEWLDLGDNLPWDDDLEADYMTEKAICQQNRTLAIIYPGGLALAPESTAIGDEVWIIAGAPMPLMLRPLGKGRAKLIGETYLHGVMHGEGLEGVDLAEFPLYRVQIV